MPKRRRIAKEKNFEIREISRRQVKRYVANGGSEWKCKYLLKWKGKKWSNSIHDTWTWNHDISAAELIDECNEKLRRERENGWNFLGGQKRSGSTQMHAKIKKLKLKGEFPEKKPSKPDSKTKAKVRKPKLVAIRKNAKEICAKALENLQDKHWNNVKQEIRSEMFSLGSHLKLSLFNSNGSNTQGPLISFYRGHTWQFDKTRMTELANEKPEQVAFGFNFVLIKSTRGNLWSFGFNSFGELGIRTTKRRPDDETRGHFNPTLVAREVEFVSAGHNHAAFIGQNGRISTWGSNENGQLGHWLGRLANEDEPKVEFVTHKGKVPFRQRPVEVPANFGCVSKTPLTVVRVECGRHFTVVLTLSRRLFYAGGYEPIQVPNVRDPKVARISHFTEIIGPFTGIGLKLGSIHQASNWFGVWTDNSTVFAARIRKGYLKYTDEVGRRTQNLKDQLLVCKAKILRPITKLLVENSQLVAIHGKNEISPQLSTRMTFGGDGGKLLVENTKRSQDVKLLVEQRKDLIYFANENWLMQGSVESDQDAVLKNGNKCPIQICNPEERSKAQANRGIYGNVLFKLEKIEF